MSKRSTHINPAIVASIATLCVGCVLLALAALASSAGATTHPTRCGVYSVRAGEPHTCIVFQCDRADEGIRSKCETYIIPAYPKPDELGEATATHRYEVETCVLSKRGNANDCSVRFTPKGGQIIAPAH